MEKFYIIVYNNPEEKLVICYSPIVWRSRYYRQWFNDIDEWLKILKFKNKKYAEEKAAYLNEIYEWSEWIVEQFI